ncbi:MAG: ATP-binding protein [Alphaproteobacteria bacterium]|nr:ATP-binding protein [Alphaproteobacteria bacterium]
MSLRSSLITSIVLVVLLTLVFGAALSYWHALSKVGEEMQAAIGVGARIASNAVDDAEESADPSRRLHLLIADFDGDRHLRATWQDSGGRTIVSSSPALPKAPAPRWFRSLIQQSEHSVRVNLPDVFSGLGHFVLETDSNNEIAEAWHDIWNTLIILGLFCGLVLASVYWIVGRALRPLDRLAASFSQIFQQSGAPQIPEQGPAELVKVYRGFNAMAARLSGMEAKNRRLAEQLATVQEEERADLARDLHDEIGPFLFSVDVDAASITRCVDANKHAEIPARVATIRESVGHMQRHVKELLGRLRTAALVDVGLVDAIDNLTVFWQTRYPDVEFIVDVPDRSFGKAIDQTAFRIVQEALSNAMRHGRPDRVEIKISSDRRGLNISITDDGAGLPQTDDGDAESGTSPPLPSSRGSGFGIAGMRERVSALDGRFSLRNRDHATGVEVSAWLPAPTASDDSNGPDTQPDQTKRQLIHERA